MTVQMVSVPVAAAERDGVKATRGMTLSSSRWTSSWVERGPCIRRQAPGTQYSLATKAVLVVLVEINETLSP